MEINLPESFINRLKQQKEIPNALELIKKLEEDAETSVRYNPSKNNNFLFNSENSVVWNEYGVYLSDRPNFGKDPFFHGGLYYPMEASSMFLDYVLGKISLSEEDLMLDLCAAPGGKSLILKDHFPENFLLSNEIEHKRAHILKENAIKWGTKNHTVINSEAIKLQKSNLKFKLILVDAPCSGEGLFRKDKASRDHWTLEKAEGCAIRQTSILEDVLPLMENGGHLIYSTCTFNPLENIDQLKWLNEHGFESIPLDGEIEKWGIEKITDENAIGYQFYPHQIKGEGFFIGLLKYNGEESQKKQGAKLPKTLTNPLPELDFLKHYLIQQKEQYLFGYTEREYHVNQALSKSGRLVKSGIYLGELKGNDFIPSYDLAMLPEIKNYPNQYDLSEAEAMNYLKGMALNIQTEKGPILLTFKGIALGFGKSNAQRINNLYPKHLRIR